MTIDDIDDTDMAQESEPEGMRASLPAMLGREKPHELQAPHFRKDYPQDSDLIPLAPLI
jgi:hypothetical protein